MDTKPEIRVRRLVHALGFRYRLHRRDLPGTPDLVFVSRRKVIFVHGCFWHQHEDCANGRVPATNTDYWAPKLHRNVERDRENQADLRAKGWDCLILWECETGDTQHLKRRIKEFLA